MPNPKPTKLKADGPSILRVGFDPKQFAALRNDEREHFAYHLIRVLSGEGSAVSEWTHLGLKVDVVPWRRS
jgi:hypothetical protein